jgi:hypothetical protein
MFSCFSKYFFSIYTNRENRQTIKLSFCFFFPRDLSFWLRRTRQIDANVCGLVKLPALSSVTEGFARHDTLDSDAGNLPQAKAGLFSGRSIQTAVVCPFGQGRYGRKMFWQIPGPR